MTSKNSGPGRRKDHPPRMVRPKQHDTYARGAKPKGSLVCKECEVVYHGGKWYWGAPPLSDVKQDLCPACARIRDRYPAGTIRMGAEYLSQAEEITNMIKNAEKAEKQEHPLERVIEIQQTEEGLVVTTTGLHIARRITSKLERRFHTKARIRYPEEQHMIFVDIGD